MLGNSFESQEAGGKIAGSEAESGLRDEQGCGAVDRTLFRRDADAVDGFVLAEGGGVVGWPVRECVARVCAPAMARLEPSPSSDTQEPASPTA